MSQRLTGSVVADTHEADRYFTVIGVVVTGRTNFMGNWKRRQALNRKSRK